MRKLNQKIVFVSAFLLLALSIYWGQSYFFHTKTTSPTIVLGDGIKGPKGMAWIPGGEFLMGSDHQKSQANERPTHKVKVSGFWLDTTHVTNDQFAQFVKETNYKTTAEQIPDWETIRVQLPPGTPRPPASVMVPGAMVLLVQKQK